MIMTERIKMMQMLYHDTWSMLLSGKCLCIFVSLWQVYLLWNIKDPVLVQILSYKRKITYYPLLICFSYKLISMQDVRKILNLNVVQYHTLNSCNNKLSPKWKRCKAEQVISVWKWSKQNTLRMRNQ